MVLKFTILIKKINNISLYLKSVIYRCLNKHKLHKFLNGFKNFTHNLTTIKWSMN